MKISDNKHKLLQALVRNSPRTAAALGRATNMKMGSLHTTLLRMRLEGLVESEGAQTRREFTITRKGVKALYLMDEICALGLSG